MVPSGTLTLRPSWPPGSLDVRSLAMRPAARSLTTSSRDYTRNPLERLRRPWARPAPSRWAGQRPYPCHSIVSRGPLVREALERFLEELAAQRRVSGHTVAAYRRDVL